MALKTAPIKVSQSTDDLISHAAHFMSVSKKSVVEQAVSEYITNHREEIHRGVGEALTQLDGSTVAAVSLLTGLSADEIDDLGGLPAD